MAKINLRDYLNGIEELIDSGQIEEALAHCHHILQIYPKHVDTYRMLGKAYLEARRHGEASDIFQRVLSSVPDDFVAHIGMSIIREDESNLDAAIWHMERAFESQPSNRAVQDELRRLYGEREGFEPPKVRLTRGALARMYAHGDLYAQAISELRSALNEDSGRPDLQVLLARMYYLTKRKADAIEVCSQLLESLPYCLYANHLMADMLTEDEHSEEAQPYLERVEELDPYAAQTNTVALPESVPADSVVVERLVLSGAAPQTEDAPRSWTGALEPIDEPQSYTPEELPDWLSAGEEEFPDSGQGEDEDDSIEYMSDEAGELFELSPEEQEGQEEDEEELEEELSPDDIPDWLTELRPGEKAGQAAPAPEDGDETADSDISDTQPRWTEEFDQAGFEPTPMPEDEEDEPEAADFDAAEALAIEGMDAANQGDDDDGLAWLEGLAAKQGADEEELITEPEEREEDKPDWLKSPEEKAEEAADSLAWLDEMAAEVEGQQAPEPADEAGEAPTQDFTAPMDEDQAEAEAAPVETASPAFLESPEDDDQPADEADDVPDWLKELGQEAAQTTTTGELNQAAFDQPPDWLDELRPTTDELEEAQAAEDDEEDADDDFDDEIEPEAPLRTRSGTADLSNLDWLEELGEPKEKPQQSTEASEIDWDQPLSERAPQAEEPDEEIETTGEFEEEDEDFSADQSASMGAWVPERELNVQAEPEEAQPPVIEMEPEAANLEPEAPEIEAEPEPEPKSNKELEHEQRLARARSSLDSSDLPDALEAYGKLIKSRKHLDEVITDLESALRQNEGNVHLWQTLGDAYMREDRLREALDCYTKAEDLL